MRVAQAVRERVARGELHLQSVDERQTLSAYAKVWLETVQGSLKASTVRFYEGNLEQHIVPPLGTRPVASIRRQDCRELIVRCRAKNLRLATIRGVVRTLSAVLSQAVEDELLEANPALRLGRYLRRGDEAEPSIDPFTRDEVAHLADVARLHFPTWHPFVLCGLRTGVRLGELLALQWSDIDWKGRFIHLQRNIVDDRLTTPKNHQARRVDLSLELRSVLRMWRRDLRAEWFAHGLPRPEWVFPSVTGTPLDASNVRKALSQILDKAELHRRGPHQMVTRLRHCCCKAACPSPM